MPIDPQQKKELETMILDIVKTYDASTSFRKQKTIDTPIDSYSVVNRRFVTLNGTVANRPRSSVATLGQHYYPTDTDIPMVYDGASWRNGVGSVVAQGRN